MTKKIISLKTIIILSFLFVIKVSGQVLNIVPLHADNQYFFIDQLWQVNITNTTATPVEGILEIKIEDRNHNVIYSAISVSIRWVVGMNTLPSATRNTMQITYAATPLGATLRETGRLPFGEYILCYTVRNVANVTLGMTCREKAIRPISPPELVSPSNGSIVDVSRPLLMWRSPFPFQSEGLTYSLRLTDVPQGISAPEALRTRPLLLNINNLREPYLAYPNTALPLDTNKIYAWQVAATAGIFSLGITDVWTFRMAQPIPDSLRKKYQSYCWVKDEEEGSYCYPTDTLKFVYNNVSNDSLLKYHIINKRGDTLQNLPTFRLKAGINPLQIAMSRFGNIRVNEIYRVIIIASDNRKYTLAFRKRRQS